MSRSPRKLIHIPDGLISATRDALELPEDTPDTVTIRAAMVKVSNLEISPVMPIGRPRKNGGEQNED